MLKNICVICLYIHILWFLQSNCYTHRVLYSVIFSIYQPCTYQTCTDSGMYNSGHYM